MPSTQTLPSTRQLRPTPKRYPKPLRDDSYGSYAVSLDTTLADVLKLSAMARQIIEKYKRKPVEVQLPVMLKLQDALHKYRHSFLREEYRGNIAPYTYRNWVDTVSLKCSALRQGVKRKNFLTQSPHNHVNNH